MSRSTQFIGLTKKAEEYVRDLEELESDSYASGMHENIPLRRWKLSKKDFGNSSEEIGACLREVVQDYRFSSGPMIFTCLESDTREGYETSLKRWKDCFLKWVEDPRVEDEFNQEKGTFWI